MAATFVCIYVAFFTWALCLLLISFRIMTWFSHMFQRWPVTQKTDHHELVALNSLMHLTCCSCYLYWFWDLFHPGTMGASSRCILSPFLGSAPRLGGSGRGHGNLFQYSCLENPMDRGAWQATAHGVAKSRTRQSGFTSLHTSSRHYIC